MQAIIYTEKQVMIEIDAINSRLITSIAMLGVNLGDIVSELNALVGTSMEKAVEISGAIGELINDAPTVEQKTQLSSLLSLYSSALDSANTLSRLVGNMSSTVSSVTSSISKSNATLVTQSAVNMPVLP